MPAPNPARCVALTIAGSDPSGGAGIQADLKTFHQFGVYGMAAVTLVTVQNTIGVSRVEVMPPDLVTEQVRAVTEDIPPGAAKTGALGNAGVVNAVGALARGFPFPLVVDPVMISKHGAPLMDADACRALIAGLLPYAFLLTPNVPEAESLTGTNIRDIPGMKRAAERLLALGARRVLVKGGHLDGEPVDVLLADGVFREYHAPRIETRHTHGTGCTYSAAITAELAKGTPLTQAIEIAKRFIAEAIRTNPGLGHGHGPVNHHAEPR